MQSLNEELQTLNAELLSKVDQFLNVDNDMKNLLNSTDIATLFLDKGLNIRRFTYQATKIFKLIKSDIGRPFTDQVSDLIYPKVVEDAVEVLTTLVFIQKQIPTKDGRWFTIRIMPYRTFEDRIDGLVITFINITDQKQLEIKLYESEQFDRLLLNSSSDVIIKLSTNWVIKELNHKAEIFFGKSRKEVIDQHFIQMFVSEPLRKKTEKDLNKLLKQGANSNIMIAVESAFPDTPAVDWSVNILMNNQKIPTSIILTSKN